MEVGKSGQFRKLAREALAAAEAVDDMDCRRALVLMASSYEGMAKKLEEISGPRIGRWDLPN
jgi:hypothetical protein